MNYIVGCTVDARVGEYEGALVNITVDARIAGWTPALVNMKVDARVAGWSPALVNVGGVPGRTPALQGGRLHW